MEQPKEEKSLKALFGILAGEVRDYLRLKAAFVRHEFKENKVRAIGAAFFLAMGAAFGTAGLYACVASGIIALGKVIPLSASAFFISLLAAALGYLAFRGGINHAKKVASNLGRAIRTD